MKLLNALMKKRNFTTFISWKQQLGLKECPFMERWVINFYFFSIRLHHWIASDDDRHFHDHPWWFWTWVITGEYGDLSPGGVEVMKKGTVRFRSALHRHTVMIKPGTDTWTLVLTGKHNRNWGFWTEGNKFVKSNKYFYTKGHHPCDSGGTPVRTFER